MKPWEFVIFVVSVFDHTCQSWRLSIPDIPFAYVDICDIENGRKLEDGITIKLWW